MRSGALRRRVLLQRRVLSYDALGQPTDEWVDLGHVWAAVEPLSARDVWAAQVAGAVATHRVRMRHRSGVLPVDRVRLRDRVLEVRGPATDVGERGLELVLTCEEVVHGDGGAQ